VSRIELQTRKRNDGGDVDLNKVLTNNHDRRHLD
jgi:hypothetical protein